MLKINLQKLILRFLHGKKTANRDDVADHIEFLIEQDEKQDDRKIKPRYVINRTIKHLMDTGALDAFESEHSTFLRLSPVGRQKLRSMHLDDPAPMPQTWDGKWRVIILDVPEEKKETRNALRYLLKKANFVCLKNSVWISPYPFEHMLINMKKDMGLTNEMIIIVTSEIDPITEEYMRGSL